MSANLGTLTLDLIAKISGFTGPLDQATKSTKKQTSEMKKAFDDWAKGIGAAVGAAAVAIPSIAAALVTSTASAAKEIQNLSNLAGLSTTEFQRYAAAAATVGIEQDKLSDIFKDTNDKVGDFLATGGGELQNFFEQIAPKVGVTAEQFRKLNSADALQLYVSSLQKANVSQAQMTFYMEAIADEATALVPLLEDGGAKFKELGDQAEATGMILSDQTIASAKEFNNQLTTLGQYANSAKTALAAEFMPVLAQLSKDLVSSTKEAGGLQNQIKSLADAMVETVAVTASVGDGIARAFNITAQALVGSFDTAMYYFNSLAAAGNDILGKITFGETSREFRTAAENMRQDALVNFGNARVAAEAINNELTKPLAGDSIREYVKNAKAAAAELTLPTPGTAGNAGILAQSKAQQEAAKAAEAAAKKINSAFESTEEGLMRQIALINTTTDKRKEATEVAKLQFDIESGKLVGINKTQQQRLEGLAAELDRLKELKKAEEDRLALAEFATNLRNENETAKQSNVANLVGAGEGDKARERAQQFLAIQEEFNDKSNALWEQLNDKSITQDRYDAETELLQEALAQRLTDQQDYYNQLDEIQGNWLLGVSDALQNYKDQATDYNAQAAQATTQLLEGTTDSLATNLQGAIMKTQSWGDAIKNVGMTFATTVIQMGIKWAAMQAIQAGLNAFSSTAAIPLVGPLAAPAAAASALAFAGGLSAQISGMAHDGIDSVPQTGTWLLQKGERVTTAQTSAKLDGTLNDIRAGQAERDARNAPNINVVEDASKAGQSRRNEDGSFTMWIANFLNEGETYDAVTGKLGLQAVGR